MILDSTLNAISRKIDLNNTKIKSLYLSNFFNAVKLSNGSVGAAMNYYDFKDKEEIHKRYMELAKLAKEDNLLLDYLSKKKDDSQEKLLNLSLKTAVASALSRKLIIDSEEFNKSEKLDTSLFSGVNSAVVIGFGGYMNLIVEKTSIKKVHISDLQYTKDNERKERIDKKLLYFKKKFPEKKITISDGKDNKERISSAELVSITGSAFCNGTMDELLDFSKHCKKIIVQGQSASIYPKFLFEKGVSLVTTTLKPDNLIQIALARFYDFRNLLDGGLPYIYLTPK